MRVDIAAVGLAAVACFLASAIYYGFVFADTYAAFAARSDGAAPWQIGAQLMRELVIVYVLARMAVLTGVSGVAGALGVALWLWFGFQAMAIAGSVIHEGYPWQLSVLHAGDALIKALLAGAILGAWPAREPKTY